VALEVTAPTVPPPDPAWLDRRREDALAAELPILDPHQHLWEQARLPYRMEDFAPVGMAVKVPLGLAVRASLPVNSIAEFRDHVGARPGQMNYG